MFDFKVQYIFDIKIWLYYYYFKTDFDNENLLQFKCIRTEKTNSKSFCTLKFAFEIEIYTIFKLKNTGLVNCRT